MIAKANDLNMETLAESKADATSRLRREGRWEKASERKEAIRQSLRDAGVSRRDARELAWESMLVEFPPLPMDDDAQEGNGDQIDARYLSDEDIEAIDTIATRTDGSDEVIHESIQWVYANIGRPKEAVGESAPSTGAYSMWLWARENRKVFYEKLLPRAIAAREKEQASLRDDGGDISALCQKLHKETVAIRERRLKKFSD